MTANEAPERLYLSKNIYSTFLYQVSDPDDDTAIEYTRTYAFIEKACKWLEENAGSYLLYPFCEYDRGSLIEDFKKAMEE